MAKGVCIVGFAASKDETPWDRPNTEFWLLNELWGWFGTVNEQRARDGKPPAAWHRWFELHDRETIGATKAETNAIRPGHVDDAAKHYAWLQSQLRDPERPIYMLEKHEDIPASVAYPLDEMARRFGRYFTSSIGYMLALAITEGRDERFQPVGDSHFDWIGVYGIDLASDTEYGDQRPNAEYFIGFARGLGIDVHLPEASALLKADHLYGYERSPSHSGLLSEAWIRQQIRAMKDEHGKAMATVNTVEGAMQAYQNVLRMRIYERRGIRSVIGPGTTA
jgi:hypothetical protein